MPEAQPWKPAKGGIFYLEQAPEICIYYAWTLVLTFRNDFLDAVAENMEPAEGDMRINEKIRFNGSLDADINGSGEWQPGQGQ